MAFEKMTESITFKKKGQSSQTALTGVVSPITLTLKGSVDAVSSPSRTSTGEVVNTQITSKANAADAEFKVRSDATNKANVLDLVGQFRAGDAVAMVVKQGRVTVTSDFVATTQPNHEEMGESFTTVFAITTTGSATISDA